MTISRSVILDKIRAAKKDMQATTDSDGAHRRILDHNANLIPARGALTKKSQVSLFINEAVKVDASIARLATSEQIPDAIAQYLKELNLPAKIKAAPRLKNLPWSATLLKTDMGIAVESDTVGVTLAFAGVAETGTLVACSGPDTPTTLNFLPVTNIVVIEESRIYGSYEEVFQQLRRGRMPADFMPRTVNFITGPSRTADIEQTLLLGAHGPQRLHILVVEDELP